MKYLLCYPDSAIPADHAPIDEPTGNVVLSLPPGWLEVRCYYPEATGSDLHFRGSGTPTWRSADSISYLFSHKAELPPLIRLPHREVWTGHSTLAPPSNGCVWVYQTEEPLPLPDAIAEELVNVPPVTPSPKRRSQFVRLMNYVNANGLPVTGIEHRVDVDIIKLNSGTAILIFNDGTFQLPEVIEKAFGPLRPIVNINNELERMVDLACRALAYHDNTYVSPGVGLVEVAPPPKKPRLCKHDNGSSICRPIDVHNIAVRLDAMIEWRKPDARKKKDVRTQPPDRVCKAIYGQVNHPHVSTIRGVRSSPILRSDGSVARVPGYDSSTGYFLDFQGEYPPLMSVAESISLYDDVLYDFPLEGCSKSGFLSCLLTLQARSAFEGCMPFFQFEANVSRAGKGLLTDIIAMILQGRKASRFSYPAKNEELAKILTSVGLSGRPYALFDNIKTKLGGGPLEAVLTTGFHEDRILGGNKIAQLPINYVLLGTANNCSYTGDMVNRTVFIRLNCPYENPSQRTGFRYPHLLDHVKANHRQLAMAGLSILSRYIEAGRPKQDIPPFGGFEGWSDLVRSSIVWAGLPDPLANREELSPVDDETDQLRELMDAWSELDGEWLRVSEAIEATMQAAAKAECGPGELPKLATFLTTLSGNHKHALGNLLRQYRDRVVGGRRFVRSKHKVPKWRLEAVQCC